MKKWLGVVLIFSSSCLPSYMKKGRQTQVLEAQPGSSAAPAFVEADNENRPRVVAIDNQTFRFQVDFKSAWNATLEVLIRNYNLNIIEQNSGLITTEWDSYYLDTLLYRNKMSVRLRRSSWQTVDVSFFNNVETLKEGSSSHISMPFWVPSPENSKEIKRVVENLAIYLNQDPPIFSNGRISKRDNNR